MNLSTGVFHYYAGLFDYYGTGGGEGAPAQSVGLDYPQAVTADAAGNVYISEYDRLRVVAPGATPTQAAAQPSFSPAGGTYTSAQTVTLASTTPNASIYVTLDGIDPSLVGIAYHGPIAVNGGVTLKAVAVAPGLLPSAESTATYTINAQPPTVLSTLLSGNFSYINTLSTANLEAKLNTAVQVALDSKNNLYILDSSNYIVWKLFSGSSKPVLFAGIFGVYGSGGDGGPATSALFQRPLGLAIDSKDNLYIADAGNDVVRQVNAATGIITTYADTLPTDPIGTTLGDGGPATQAWINYPVCLAMDTQDNLYICDQGNQRVRKVDGTGTISTIAGGGKNYSISGDGGPATSACVYPSALAFDGQGNIFEADGEFATIRKIDTTGNINRFAGDGVCGDGGDGKTALLAQVCTSNLAVDKAGNVYFSSGYRIREIAADGSTVTNFAGNDFAGFYGDGGSATLGAFSGPYGITLDANGNLYIADTYNNAIRKVTLAANLPQSNPTPAISGLTPAHAQAGGAAFTLKVNGSGFVNGSTIYWGSTALTTTYGSATQLTASVAASQIASLGAINVTVQSPAPGGGTSSSFSFQVDTASATLSPTAASATATVSAGSPATYTITLSGSPTGVRWPASTCPAARRAAIRAACSP